MQRNIIETITGIIVVVIAIWFVVVFINQTGNVKIKTDSYNITAKFETVEGIEEGSHVKIGGVNVGIVSKKTLDPISYLAVIHMAINKDIKIPSDSMAQITSSGLLGEKFLSIVPGADYNELKNNGEIRHTQSSLSIETLISKMLYSLKSDK